MNKIMRSFALAATLSTGVIGLVYDEVSNSQSNAAMAQSHDSLLKDARKSLGAFLRTESGFHHYIGIVAKSRHKGNSDTVKQRMAYNALTYAQLSDKGFKNYTVAEQKGLIVCLTDALVRVSEDIVADDPTNKSKYKDYSQLVNIHNAFVSLGYPHERGCDHLFGELYPFKFKIPLSLGLR